MKKNVLRNEKGFTLIEIIAVLVILGILMAVAVPKYFAMQYDAQLASEKGAISEGVARVTGAYGKFILNKSGTLPTMAQLTANAAMPVKGINGSDFTMTCTGATNAVVVTLTAAPWTPLQCTPAAQGACKKTLALELK